MPHAQIACFYGDTAEASAAADRQLPDDVDRVVLVDWENDVIGTTMRVVNDVFKSNIGSGKGKLFGVRFDTSGNMRDKSVPPRSKKLSCGVCAELVAMARTWFDHNELKDLKIIVSGGFNEDKIREFETMGVKVDMYGVGSSVLKNMHLYDFTSDIVRVDRDECSKVGRRCRPTDRMKHIT